MSSGRLARAALPAWVCIAVLLAGCEPLTGQPSTGSLTVHINDQYCSMHGDCESSLFEITGSGFTPGTTLRVFIPAMPQGGVDEVVFASDAYVGASGGFQRIEMPLACDVVARPWNAPGALAIVADEVPSGVRRSFTYVDRGKIICEPPFVRLTYTRPCGAPDLCPQLTNDSVNSIGVHWIGREAGYDNYRIRYARMDADTWIETREFGDDVGNVAVNNLETGVTYEFELLACYTHFLGSSDCTGWQPVGLGAAG